MWLTPWSPKMPNLIQNHRRLAIPLAALLPAFTIAFAFSLGPSPRKRVFDFEQCQGSSETCREILTQTDPQRMGAALAERIVDARMGRRAEAVAYVGTIQAKGAVPFLERIAKDPKEPIGLRKVALESALEISRRSGLGLAEHLQRGPGELGRAAREVLSRQERTERPVHRAMPRVQ